MLRWFLETVVGYLDLRFEGEVVNSSSKSRGINFIDRNRISDGKRFLSGNEKYMVGNN